MQKQLSTLFDAMIDEGTSMVGAEYCNMWLLDASGTKLWSRSRQYKLPSPEQLKLAFDHVSR